MTLVAFLVIGAGIGAIFGLIDEVFHDTEITGARCAHDEYHAGVHYLPSDLTQSARLSVYVRPLPSRKPSYRGWTSR